MENMRRLTEVQNIHDMPSYVMEEAEKVADKVLSVRNADNFVFGAFSDSHTTGSDESAAGVRHAGMAMNAINDLTQLDLVANFGDACAIKFDDDCKPVAYEKIMLE